MMIGRQSGSLARRPRSKPAFHKTIRKLSIGAYHFTPVIVLDDHSTPIRTIHSLLKQTGLINLDDAKDGRNTGQRTRSCNMAS
jgi:hypothetical protein